MKILLLASLLSLAAFNAQAASSQPVYAGTVCQKTFEDLHKQRIGGVLTIIPMQAADGQFNSIETYAEGNPISYKPQKNPHLAPDAQKRNLKSWLVLSASQKQPASRPMSIQLLVADPKAKSCLTTQPQPEPIASLWPEILPEVYLNYKYYNRRLASYPALQDEVLQAAYETPYETLITEIGQLIAAQ